MTTTPRPVPRLAPLTSAHAPSSMPAPELAARLEAAADLPLEERAAELAAIHEALTSQLRQTEN